MFKCIVQLTRERDRVLERLRHTELKCTEMEAGTQRLHETIDQHRQREEDTRRHIATIEDNLRLIESKRHELQEVQRQSQAKIHVRCTCRGHG